MAKKDETKPDEVKPEEAPTTHVKMKRMLQPGQQGPATADVHKDEVDHWSLHGWQVAGE